MKYVDLVQVGMGTDSIPSFSRGNPAPLATLPFGMASFGIETRPSKFSLFYHPDDPITTGVRLTHLPSPWIADYAFVTFMPQTGQTADLTANCKSGYRRREALMKPYALRLTFLRYRARMELAPTMRGCAADVTWERADEGLPVRRATCVAFDPFDSETIVVGTSGGGFFRARWPR